MMDFLENINAIKIETPVDKIIKQLRDMISSGKLQPGDKLPAERVLAEKFQVGRSYVREAIMRLELYGLLKTSPQSGTIVAGISLKIVDSIFTDVINFNKDNFSSLVEARYFFEINSARLAAVRRTDQDIKEMEAALDEFDARAMKGQNHLDADMLFHIKIAGATKNDVFESMILILIPDLMKNIIEKNICGTNRGLRSSKSINEHRKILDAIVKGDPELAGAAMAEHLTEILEISKKLS
jgi:GntR family transcriptional repressor for pyruvate dehydrogenase complex